VKILIPNKITKSRYLDVLEKMKKMGPPVIECYQLRSDTLFALEGSHRITAAKELGIVPICNVIIKLELIDVVTEFAWVRIQARQRERKGLVVEF